MEEVEGCGDVSVMVVSSVLVGKGLGDDRDLGNRIWDLDVM